MIDNQTVSTQDLLDCLRDNYGLKIEDLRFLPLGADLNSSVYKARTHDNRLYFIKLKRNYRHDINLAVTRLLHETGIQQIILPVKTLQGQEAQCIDNATVIVYPYIEGKDGFSRELTNDQWFLLGKAFRQIHEIEVPSSLLNQIPRETYSNKWQQMVMSFLIEEELKLNNNEIGLKLMEFVKENKVIIRKLVDRAYELGQKAKEQSTKFVLCHSDIHGGNVLIDEENDFYIVDWDEPIMAPKERDLMFVGGGVANVWNKPHEEMFFYKGYGESEVNQIILAYYRHERIVEDIAIYCQELLLASVSSGDRQVIYKHFMDMFEPQGVVDIAFQTYEGFYGH